MRDGGFSIELESEYLPGLKELETFSHINVFWWCHLHDDRKSRSTLECEQPYRKGPADIGVFTTRSEYRPNPIALTAVAMLGIDQDKGIIHIPYIDAEDGTPVIDLMPYQPSVDRIRDVSVPEWCDHWPKWHEDSADFDWESEFRFPV
ncbi:MAG: SAM-dependent methyltransferase [Actinomycetota bacterium]|nr:SAM-dependent methyltransferase [Actinomycetota bacterium]